VASYALLRGPHSSAKITLDLPVTSTSRDARREELRKHPELANAPVYVTIQSSGRSVRAVDADWRRPSTVASHRAKAKEVIGHDLLTAMAGIREIAGLPMFADLNASLGYVFDESELVDRTEKLMVASTTANCAFDAKFALPCER